MEQNKTGKYLKYAIGEIVLVMIGILLALQVNNWNSNRIEQETITNYYERIVIELDEEIVKANLRKKDIDTLIVMNRRALNILNSKNIDSLNTLKTLLGATATNWTEQYSFPITNEFINQDYLAKIKNDSLKMTFKIFSGFLEYVEQINEVNNVQYQNTIEPFFIKNINYSQTALKKYRNDLIQGGPKTDLELLFDNLEIWNIITFKLELLNIESEVSYSAIYIFESHKSMIKNELNKK